MNSELKNALKESFEAPAPTRKKEFFLSIQRPSISNFKFVITQISYIRKWVWVISALIFMIALVGAEYLEKDMLWCVSAFMPLLALAVITESGRSETYGMVEFEMSTRFSLRRIVLARLGILGVTNFVLFCMLIPIAFMNSQATVLQTGVYMACPYLLTTFGGLWAVRKVRGIEEIYLCIGIAIGVSIMIFLISCSSSAVYMQHNFIWWIAALIIFGTGTVYQCFQMIKQTEELTWSL